MIRMCAAGWKIARRIFTYDVSPETSRKIRAAVLSPLGVLAIAVAVSALIGLVLHPRVFALSAGLTLVMVSGICWPWLVVRGVAGRIRFEESRCAEGDRIWVSCTVINRLPWGVRGLFVVDPERSDPVTLPRIRSYCETHLRWEDTAHQRGRKPKEPLRICCSFPFGIWVARRTLAVETVLIVRPRTFPVGPVPRSHGEAAVVGQVGRIRSGTSGESMGVRPYRRGDSPRRIHWAQTARHDRLIVQELQQTTRPSVTIVLDTDTTAHSSGRNGSLEWAIRCAASAAVSWTSGGAEVGMLLDGRSYSPRSGAAHSAAILDDLALWRPTIFDLSAWVGTMRRAARDSVVVLITTDGGRVRLEKMLGSIDVRWLVLADTGFGVSSNRLPAPASGGGSWLRIDSPESAPSALRFGSSEACHGA